MLLSACCCGGAENGPFPDCTETIARIVSSEMTLVSGLGSLSGTCAAAGFGSSSRPCTDIYTTLISSTYTGSGASRTCSGPTLSGWCSGRVLYYDITLIIHCGRVGAGPENVTLTATAALYSATLTNWRAQWSLVVPRAAFTLGTDYSLAVVPANTFTVPPGVCAPGAISDCVVRFDAL